MTAISKMQSFSTAEVPLQELTGAISEGPFTATDSALDEADDGKKENDRFQHINEHMLRLKKWLLADVSSMALAMKNKESKKKGSEHRTKRTR
jgi:hypothetical protein